MRGVEAGDDRASIGMATDDHRAVAGERVDVRLDGSGIGWKAATMQLGRPHHDSSLLQGRDDKLPAPGTVPSTMHENHAGHVSMVDDGPPLPHPPPGPEPRSIMRALR